MSGLSLFHIKRLPFVPGRATVAAGLFNGQGFFGKSKQP